MGFAFHIGAPGPSVRITARGVRTSAVPSSPVLRGPRGRLACPSSAQLERARRAAEQAPDGAARTARLVELDELCRRSTSWHQREFPRAGPPRVPLPPLLGLGWATAEAEAFHLRGVGPRRRSERAAARRRADRDAPAYLAAEQARLDQVYHRLTEQAATAWQALLAGDESMVCSAVDAALTVAATEAPSPGSSTGPERSPSPGSARRVVAVDAGDGSTPGCAVGLRHGVLSAVLRQRDIDPLPHQVPGLSPIGRPTLTTLTARERLRWWLEVMGSQVIATVKAAFAAAPGVRAVDVAVLTRVADVRRVGVVAYGRWTRHAVASTAWGGPHDALRFLDVGEDVVCAVSTSPPRVGSVDVDRVPQLRTLLDAAVVDGLDGHADPLPPPVPEPYATRPFAHWVAGSSTPVATG